MIFSKKMEWPAITNIYTNMYEYMSEEVYYIEDFSFKNLFVYHKS